MCCAILSSVSKRHVYIISNICFFIINLLLIYVYIYNLFILYIFIHYNNTRQCRNIKHDIVMEEKEEKKKNRSSIKIHILLVMQYQRVQRSYNKVNISLLSNTVYTESSLIKHNLLMTDALFEAILSSPAVFY